MGSNSAIEQIRREKIQELKKIVRSLVIPFKEGLTMDRFKEEYYMCEGHSFRYDEVGFKSDIDLLLSFGDVVKFGFNKKGERVLLAVVDESVAHIHTLVDQQRVNSMDEFQMGTNFSERTNQIPCQFKRRHKKAVFVPIKTRKRIVDLLYKYSPEGLRLTTFFGAYEFEFKEPLNHEDLGFKNLCDFLDEMSNICASHNVGHFSPVIRLLNPLYEHLKKHKDEADRYETYLFKSVFERIFAKYDTGVPVLKFCEDYAKLYGRELDPSGWGFSTPMEIFTSLPSLFIIIPANVHVPFELRNRCEDDHYLLNAKKYKPLY